VEPYLLQDSYLRWTHLVIIRFLALVSGSINCFTSIKCFVLIKCSIFCCYSCNFICLLISRWDFYNDCCKPQDGRNSWMVLLQKGFHSVRCLPSDNLHFRIILRQSLSLYIPHELTFKLSYFFGVSFRTPWNLGHTLTNSRKYFILILKLINFDIINGVYKTIVLFC